MKRMRYSLAGMALAVLVLPTAGFAQVEVSVSTDKSSYYVGENIAIYVTAHNLTAAPQTLQFGSTLQAQYTLDGAFTTPTIGLDILTSQYLPPYGSYTWSFSHSWSAYYLALGGHSVNGTVVGYGESEAAAFEVLAPPPPPEDVFIDFSKNPYGQPLTSGLNVAYLAWGVSFAERGTDYYPSVQTADDGNKYASMNRCVYPPGFNIAADFSVPVYSVSADIATAVGVSIRMIALDADGNLLDTDVSPPQTSLNAFTDRLTVSSDTPMACVEWWPSDERAGVRIDNVYMNLNSPILVRRGDFNQDGVTDLSDYTVWADNYGATGDVGSLEGDANRDGRVDLADYTIWADSFLP
jgi:hypothetical protein